MNHNERHQPNQPHSLATENTSVVALNDGADSVWARQLHQAMTQLPTPRPPPAEESWQQVRSALQTRRRARQRRYSLLATAALLAMALGVWRLWPPQALPDGMGDPAAPMAGAMAQNSPSVDSQQANSQHEVAALMDMSRQLENVWQHVRQRQRQRTMSGAEMERQMQLAGLIASVDARLTAQTVGYQPDAERERNLWRQRVVLMNELVAGEVQAEPAVWTL